MLCVKAGGWLKGTVILPELIRQNRAEHVEALRKIDDSYANGRTDLAPLHEMLERLLKEQLATNGVPVDQ